MFKFAGAFLLVSNVLFGDVRFEKNSTPCFPVGTLGSRWEFPSDHLPVGASIDDLHIVCWNILDSRALHWIEGDGQGLKESAIMRDHHRSEEVPTLTLRETKIVKMVLEMIDHPLKPKAVVALEETSPEVLDYLLEVLPKRMRVLTTFTGEMGHGDIFIYDKERFRFESLEAGYLSQKKATWMILRLQDGVTEQKFAFIQSHLPGGALSESSRKAFAGIIFSHFDSNEITVIMGDQNRSTDYFLKDLKEVFLAHHLRGQPFKEVPLPYPTHINTLKEASWIDNIFVALPQLLPITVKGEADFPQIESPLSELWSHFSLHDEIKEAREKLESFTDSHHETLELYDELIAVWRKHFLEREGKFDLERLLSAVVFASEKHGGRECHEGSPSLLHPLKVAQNLWMEGEIRNVEVLIAALLYGTLEERRTTKEEIEREFGAHVLSIVEEVTEDPTPSETKRGPMEHALPMSLDAQNVKLADRLANLRDLSKQVPSKGDLEEVNKYFLWSESLLTSLKGANKGLENALEICIERHYESPFESTRLKASSF